MPQAKPIRCPAAARPLVIALLGMLALPAGQALAQSFNCGAAYYLDEKSICHDPYLSGLDQALAQSYRHAAGALDAEQREQFHRNEVAFVQARRRCGDNHQCIAHSYVNRIRELTALLSQDEEDQGEERSNGVTRRDSERAAEAREPRDKQKEPAPARAEPMAPEPKAKTASRQPAEASGSTSADATATLREPAAKPRAQPKRHQQAAATTAPGAGEAGPPAPAKSAAVPAQPTIQWANPPPAR